MKLDKYREDIERLLEERVEQKEIAYRLGIPTSTLSDYVRKYNLRPELERIPIISLGAGVQSCERMCGV